MANKQHIVFSQQANGNPCTADCPDRTSTCHDTCGRFLFWVRKTNARKKKAHGDRDIELLKMDSAHKAHTKALKGRKKGVY